jgi:hypothetical protein
MGLPPSPSSPEKSLRPEAAFLRFRTDDLPLSSSDAGGAPKTQKKSCLKSGRDSDRFSKLNPLGDLAEEHQ